MSDDTPPRARVRDPLDEIHDICLRQPEGALSEVARVLGLEEIEASLRATIDSLRSDLAAARQRLRDLRDMTFAGDAPDLDRVEECSQETLIRSYRSLSAAIRDASPTTDDQE